jgi:ATP phosphoribosyltransferase
MLNVRKQDLAGVLSVLPALQKPTISTLSDGEWVAVNTIIEESPTISTLSDGEWVAVNTIIEESTAWKIMPQLKAAKAEGIVEYPLNKVVL